MCGLGKPLFYIVDAFAFAVTEGGWFIALLFYESGSDCLPVVIVIIDFIFYFFLQLLLLFFQNFFALSEVLADIVDELLPSRGHYFLMLF